MTRAPATSPPGSAREEASVLGALVVLFLITSAWWALAFWPVADGPIWLERTRAVCFGVTESGLPNAGGWIGLVFGPLGMLAILVVGWSDTVFALLRRARVSRGMSLTFGSLALGCLMLVTGAAARVWQARAFNELPPAGDESLHGLTRLDRAAPDLTLSAHDGVIRSLSEHAGRPVLVTFAFGHCETVCPLVIRDVLAAQQILRSRGDSVGVMIVTLDPWRDTPSRLSSMAAGWKLPPREAWLLGGTVTQVEDALDAWGVPRVRDSSTGEVTHPAIVFVIDAKGRIAFTTAGGTTTLVNLVERL